MGEINIKDIKLVDLIELKREIEIEIKKRLDWKNK